MDLKAAVADEALLQVRLESGRTVEEELKALRALAKLLDSQFEVMGVKFGADALVGLIPVAGDGVTLVTGGAALGEAARRMVIRRRRRATVVSLPRSGGRIGLAR